MQTWFWLRTYCESCFHRTKSYASSRFAGLPWLGYGAHQLLFSPSTTCAGHNSSFHHSTAVNLSLDRGSPSRQGVQGVQVFVQCGSSELQLSKFILRSNRCITISTVTTAETEDLSSRLAAWYYKSRGCCSHRHV